MVPERERERATIELMIGVFCRDHHTPAAGLCTECTALAAYASQRLEKCPFGEEKPTCAQCPIHCYKPACREQIREVMRYAGPRLMWRRPLRAIRHLLHDRRPAPPLPGKKQPPKVHRAADEG
jgi:hypothetical protein